MTRVLNAVFCGACAFSVGFFLMVAFAHSATFVPQWDTYCATTKNEIDLCAPSDSAHADYDDAYRAAVVAHSAVSHGWREVPDTDDVWEYSPDRVGDCDDQAIYAASVILQRGVPRGAVYFAVVEMWHGEHHMITLVDTDRGALVIDPLMSRVRTYDDYRYILRQIAGMPSVWVAEE